MEFRFHIVETQQGSITVEADDYKEALKKAWEIYDSKAVNWADVEMSLEFERSYE